MLFLQNKTLRLSNVFLNLQKMELYAYNFQGRQEARACILNRTFEN